ncbi:MAG: UDP-3-O-(3-hydroxymyristoyl)glucosamine N-acyltransferase [Gammaproteobacteria bacterium]
MAGFLLGELAKALNLELHGDPDCRISSAAPLYRAQPDELAFLSDRRRRKELSTTEAGAVILTAALADHYPGNRLISDSPHADFARAMYLLYPREVPEYGVHPKAIISPSAELADHVTIGPGTVIEEGASIGEGSVIGAGCVVEKDAIIGRNCKIHSNVTIAHGVCIGDRVEIHSGAVLGADGFGLAKEGERWIKVPQIGTVVIGDDVEIGANTTIDRGALDDTVLEQGVKLDNQIQVGHNVRIGAHTAIAGCVGIAGSAVIGARCTIGGAAGILGHLRIVDDVHITAMSLVTSSITEPGSYSSGTPLEKSEEWHRNCVRFKQLDQMAKRLKKLEKQIAEMSKDIGG